MAQAELLPNAIHRAGRIDNLFDFSGTIAHASAQSNPPSTEQGYALWLVESR